MKTTVTIKDAGNGNTEVRLAAERIYEPLVSNEVHRNSYVLRELRKAGVPVVGAISILSVEFGVFTMAFEDDLDGGKYIYTWVGKTAQMVVPCPVATSEFPLKTKLAVKQKPNDLFDDDL